MLKNMVPAKIRAKILAKLELPGYVVNVCTTSSYKFALLAVEEESC